MAADTMNDAVRKFLRAEEEADEHPPPITIRFFYTSPLEIDDPLSPVPPPTSTTAASSKQPPRPFSDYDHNALDKSWYSLQHKLRKSNQKKREDDYQALINMANEPDLESRRPSGQLFRPSSRGSAGSRVTPSICVEGRRSNEQRHVMASASSSFQASSSHKRRSGPRRSLMSDGETLQNEEFPAMNNRPMSRMSPSPQLNPVDDSDVDAASEFEKSITGTTGTPFIRAPSRSKIQNVWQKGQNMSSFEGDNHDSDDNVSQDWQVDSAHKIPSEKEKRLSINIPVGVSRLHQVVMPDLQMLPIYWSPGHDISSVVRGTWFYKDTMLPVEPDVANMLEAGYVTLKPWTQTWNDELNSAVEVGAVGEEKIVHPLWPEPPSKQTESRPTSIRGLVAEDMIETTPESKRAEALQISVKLIDSSTGYNAADHKAAGASIYGSDGKRRQYATSAVIYSDAKHAYLLRPNLQPSAYHRRRPLAHYIRRGFNIGICVIRGFDQSTWDRLHPAVSVPKTIRAEQGVSTSEGGTAVKERHRLDSSLRNSLRPAVTDLVLVIHGIGQKLSERMESFHFTHAMNAFRREVNVELGSNNVKAHLRGDMGGIMVLPVNWRSTLKFEDGGYKTVNDGTAANSFTLKDITPNSLPSVRNIVSDVLLDIPFYLSHHQPKMIAAVVQEANSIFKLWCQNNPGFQDYGRVHLIAHSLGSVMAVDILSNQPTFVDTDMFSAGKDESFHFAFDTKNLYLCGSPAGLFLLLKKANLLPRRGREKSGSEGEDQMPGVAGEKDTYGCLAVDNIYNIVNPYDPVAYQLNATVDSTYAASLRHALIPSISTSWFAFSNPFRKASSSVPSRKRPLTLRLPSNVELDMHNFTREEIAERRAYLLNDNGQIDFFLKYGGGPLEIQYLTMLGAHSSYWLSKDFTRFVVLEIGRSLGKDGTLEGLRATKKKVARS